MVKIITSQDTHPLRLLVLRPGMPPESAILPNDNATGTFHLGYYEGEELVSIATFMLSENNNETSYQLRGMATHPDFLRKGYAKELILTAEKILKALKISSLWFNAREVAIPFYEKLGYEIISDAFMVERIGVHYKMKKQLTE